MKNRLAGFTIIELLVVIVVIGILATIVTVSYISVVDKAHDTALQVDVDNSAMLLETYKAQNHKYPTDPKLANDGKDLPASDGNAIAYQVSSDNKNYCVAASRNGVAYHKSNITDKIETGDCSTVSFPAIVMQTITTANCPTARARAVDARDNHTYWVQKLADGKCWMLTNLGYAGGGTNTYNDTISIAYNLAYTYTAASYYNPAGSNVTTEPANPSTSTTGTGQYGYLYNWCAAMGGQATAACSGSATTPSPVTTTSICPSGWRLPTGNNTEMKALNDAVNSGSTSSDSGLINTPWLGQRSGYWYSGFGDQGTFGYYWSSTQYSSTNGYNLLFGASGSYPYDGAGSNKYYGYAVRCITTI